MPPTRRSPAAGGPAVRGAQSKISFGSRVTKPSSTRGRGAGSKALKDVDKIETASIPSAEEEVDRIEVAVRRSETSHSDTPGHVSSEAVVAKQAKIELDRIGVAGRVNKSAAELSAVKVSDAQIRRYWNDRENERIAKRVHQESITTEEKILRLFDMTSSYGPCVGMARMKRWVRANKLGLEPPIEVLAVLLKEEKKGNGKIEKAYVDELMSSKLGGSEV